MGVGDVTELLHVVHCCVHVGRVCSSQTSVLSAWPDLSKEAVTLNNCDGWFVHSMRLQGRP